MMLDENQKQMALKHFIECRLLNSDYMATHSLEDVRQSALRRRYVLDFDNIWNKSVDFVNKTKRKTKTPK
ncbi:MAG: hypothetical protein WA667_26640 [Candidatus Nitrosopolaris sp.]